MNDYSAPDQPSALDLTFDYFVELMMAILPQDAFSMRLKRRAIIWRGGMVGRGTKVWRDVWIDDYRRVVIGDDVTIGKSVLFVAGGQIQVDDRVMIGHGAKLISSGHRIPEMASEPMRWSGPEAAPIRLHRDCWIGAGAIILPGVTVGEGAVVAAGAVVSRNVEPYAIVAGVPARPVKNRPGANAVDVAS